MANYPDTQELIPYLDALGLECPPFTAQLRDDQYFLDPALEQHLNQLRHLTQGKPMLLVVSGPPDAGKSTLKQMFLNSAADNLVCCEVNADAETNATSMLHRIAACLDLPDNLADKLILTLIEDKIRSLVKHDRFPVLLVDDAHLLPTDAIDMLLGFQANEHQALPLRVVLFTDPSLTSMLLQVDIQQHYITLNSFTRQQIRAYLEHRLKLAGMQQEFPFDENDLEQIEKQSGGRPGEINQAAHNSLMEKFSHPTRKKAKAVQTGTKTRKGTHLIRWLIIVAIACLVTTALLFQKEINSLFQGKTSTHAVKKESLKLPAEKTYLLKKVPKTTVIQRARPFVPPAREPKLAKTAPPPTSPTIPEKQTIASDKKVSTAGKKIPPVTAVNPPAKPTTPAPETDSAGKYKTDKYGLLGKPWILSRKPDHYSIQLAAAANPQTLRELVINSKLGNPKAMFTLLRNGKDWNVLLYGDFANWQQAMKAIEHLPKPIRKSRPWARKFAKIQEEIRLGHK